MKPLSKKYIIFFILAYLTLRLPEIAGPKISSYLLKKGISLAGEHGVTVHIHTHRTKSFREIIAERLLISNNSNQRQKYLIDSLSIFIERFFSPKIQINAKVYEGDIRCAIEATSIIELLRKNKARMICNITSVQLQSLPHVGDLNILGTLDSSIETSFEKTFDQAHISGEIKITNGYIDPATSFCDEKNLRTLPPEMNLACFTIKNYPPMRNIELFSSLSFNQNQLELHSAQTRSNYGLFQGKGKIIKPFPTFMNATFDLKGDYTLSSISKELFGPWIPLINNGIQLTSDKGGFSIQGTRPKVDVRLLQ